MTNVLPGAENGYCGAIAHELHRIADDLAKAAHVELPEPRQFQINIQPGGETDEQVIAGIDAIGAVLLGASGKHDTANSAPWYVAEGMRGQVKVSCYRGLTKPPDKRDAELERLRARVAELEADRTGLAYTRADDDIADPTPPGPREPLHTGGMTAGGLVDETPDEPVAEHEISTAWKGDESGQCGVECRCGVTYDGFDSLAEAEEHLLRHIEAATSPTGLTKAADETRGPLAGTTPVVTYFSFGHGQTDPQSGQRLLDHYVTVVAPTYDACREAMFASRFGRAWSFDYLAGTPRATEWIPRWTEHEVIVAPGTDPALAEAALKAAADLLAGRAS